MDKYTRLLKDLHEMLVGLEVGFAKDMLHDLADGWDLTIRVVRCDGQPVICTRDYKRDRVNVATEGGVIKSIVSIG